MDYARAQALALKLINKNGRSVSIQRLSETPADPNKPWKGAGTPTVAQTVSLKAVFLPHASADLGRLGIDEELLKRVEQVALVPGGSVDLEPFNTFLDAGVRWAVEWVQALKPADIVVLYAFGVKR